MPDNSYKILISMRVAHWSLAKGRLQAMLDTFWPEPSQTGSDPIFMELLTLIEEFIGKVDEILE